MRENRTSGTVRGVPGNRHSYRGDDKTMNIEKDKKPFIPRDKPKSWVIGILSGLCGLLIAGPLMFLGYFLKLKFLRYVGISLFMGCWFTFALMWLLFVLRLLLRKYKKIIDKEWQDQVW